MGPLGRRRAPPPVSSRAPADEYLGWRAVFLVNPPLIVVMLALLPQLPARDRRLLTMILWP
jgi:hypothetical protein